MAAEIVHRFAKGQRVRLVNADAMSADLGAPARVIHDQTDSLGYISDYVIVEWEPTSLRHFQFDGGYLASRFEPADTITE